MKITIAPICMTEASVLEERQRNAVDATSSSKTTMMPTKVTIHMMLRFMLTFAGGPDTSVRSQGSDRNAQWNEN